MTTKDRRVAPRRGIRWKALMLRADGSPIGECTIVNVSSSGAMLILEDRAAEPPGSFALVFARNGTVRRRCEITWRSDEGVGVKFVRSRATAQAHSSRATANAASLINEVAEASAD
jgi:hypothetical protein